MTVLVTTVAVLGLAGWGTLQLVDVFDGDAAAKGKPAQAANASKERACKAVAPAPGTSGTKPIVFPEPGQLTVNVYNATAKSGLAKKTADQLAARGFKIGTFGNADPEYDRKVTAAALLLGGSGTKAEAAMKLVGAQFKGTTTYKPAAPKSKHAANTVDLMLGKGFTTLAADRVVERNLVVLAKPSAAPRPAGC